MALSLQELKTSDNIAELLDESELGHIGQKVLKGFQIDEESRSEWLERVDLALEIAQQTMETKNHPWPGASNVKYPLITQAAIDFAARTYPELIKNDRVAKTARVGLDPDGSKARRGERVSRHLSYQILHQMTDFEDTTDRLLHILPMVGTVFKKTYYDVMAKRPESELCMPDQIVINYHTPSLEDARRISHVLLWHMDEIVQRIRSGIFLDVDLEQLRPTKVDEDDEDSPLELIESHCYLDLDDDGYQEPYIVTCHKESGQVLRIVNRFSEVKTNKNGEVIRIVPDIYFTDYHFIRSPDGGFYSMGLGTLLYPLNSAINTLINQLIDAGTLNNMQGGFLGRGLRLKNGEFRLELGEWKVLDAAAGTNIAQNVVPLPTKEPSGTLFSLLGLLIDIGKDLVSATDIMQGKGQTQNVAASTVFAMMQQGMRVFNAINKRLYRAMRKELQKVFLLNSKHLTQSQYAEVLDDPEADVKSDYNVAALDILPVADPSASSDAERIAKAQSVLGLSNVNRYEAEKYVLETLHFEKEEIDRFLPQPDPNAPPPAEEQKLMAEVDKLRAEAQARMAEVSATAAEIQLEEIKVAVQRDEALMRAEESAARIMKMKQDALNNNAKTELAGAKANHEAELATLDLLHKREKDEVDLSIKAVETSAKIQEENNPDERDNA